MKRKYKSKKFNFLGISVFIRISYPAKRKSQQINFNFAQVKKFAFPIFALPFLLLILIGAKSVFENGAYLTKTSPLLEKISPVLGKVKRSSPIFPLPKDEKIIFHGSRDKKQIALTFDADMTPEMKLDLETGYAASYYDQDLIKTLEDTQTKATLFLSGMWIERYFDTARELSQNSLFELGNHTYSHPAFEGACYGLTLAHDEQKEEELTKTQKLLKEISGFDNKLFRFPGGCYSTADLDIVSKTGQIAIQWDVVGQDGFNGDTENIVSNVVDNVKNGSIIVMHMNGYPNEPATSLAIPIIITTLRERGFEFVTVSELLNLKKEDPAQVKNLFSLNID